MSALEDAALVGRVLDGEVEAYSQLVRKYQSAVYGLAYHLVGNFADAEDLAQEAFLRAYLDLGQLRQPEKFAAWLRQVTTNICRMWLRKRREDVVPLDAKEILEMQGQQFLPPDEELERRELHDAVMKAVAELPEHYRLAVTLYYLDGLSYQQIGDFLGVPVSTVRGRLHKARRKLKQEMIAMVQENFNSHKVGEEFTKNVEQKIQIAKGLPKNSSCETPYHEGVRFISESDQEIEIWYLGNGVYDVKGEVRVVWYPEYNPPQPLRLKSVKDMQFSLSELHEQAESGESMIANIDRGSCGTPFHYGVHFVNTDGKPMKIWYLGEDKYRVEGQTRIVFNPRGLVSEAPGEMLKDTIFDIDELRRKRGLPLPLNLLAVEKELTRLEALHSTLYKQGYAVQVTDTIEEAFKRLRKHDFDVVLLDAELSDEIANVADQIKKITPDAKIFIEVQDVSEASELKELGWDVLLKPCQIEDLLAKMRGLAEASG